MKNLLIDHTPFQIANIQILENKQLGEGKSLMTLVGKLQEAEQKNGNGRVYPREILEREVKKYADGPVKTRTALGELDHRNWVWDFGGMKRSKTQIAGMSPKEYFSFLLDHTTVVAIDDPYLKKFQQMDEDGIIQLRILPATGCEKFAEHLYYIINAFLKEETEGRVKAIKVEVYEHERNSASYGE